MDDSKPDMEIIDKDLGHHFLPTYRIKSKLYPVPIIIAIVAAGLLAYLTYVVAGITPPDEGSEPIAGILYGIFFIVIGAVSAFVIVFLAKKVGANILKYIFGLSFAFTCFFFTLLFASTIIYLIFIQFPETQFVVDLYLIISNIILPIITGIFTAFLIYKYFTTKSINTKNIIVLYIGLLVSASMSVSLHYIAIIAILIGLSLWDIFGVLYKRGPIKELVELVMKPDDQDTLDEENVRESIKEGTAVYDTSTLEIGIGDLAFYSLLTSTALIHTGNLLVAILTAVAIIIGTGITLLGLKRNKLLPGLPISIFLGIGTMFLSWFLISIF